MSAITNHIIRDFKAFVKSQPVNLAIDHHSWDACAVGRFSELNGIGENMVTHAFSMHYGFDNYLLLGNGGSKYSFDKYYDSIEEKVVDISTYGKLSIWLDSLGV